MKILIADDDLIFQKILKATLARWGYEVEAVQDGQAAVDAFSHPMGPKLAVLDWMMPKLSGIQVCKKLKEENPTVYIVLITSVDEPNAMTTALLAGADDFLPKPFKRPELQARLEVGKRVVQLYEKLSEANDALRRYANEMEALAHEKADQLMHAERLSVIGMLTAGIAHEINNPNTFISANVQTLQKFWQIQAGYLEECPATHPNHDKLMFIAKEIPETLEGIMTGTKRISAIVNGLKSFARQDTAQHIDYDLHQVIEDALLLCRNVLKYSVTVEKSFAEKLPVLKGDPQKIEQVFVNLFSNAAYAMHGKKNAVLTIHTFNDVEHDLILVDVLDNGMGFSEDALKKIWDPFFTTKTVGEGTGLGMSISHGIITSHGGTITVANRPEGGAAFHLVLPRNR